MSEAEPMVRGSSWRLKVLSGLHMGAEVELGWNAYSLGSGARCDLVLGDAGIPALALELQRVGDALQVRPRASDLTVSLDGRLTEGELEAQPCQVVGLGQTFFAVGPWDADWMGLRPPLMLDDAAVGDDGEALANSELLTGEEEPTERDMELPEEGSPPGGRGDNPGGWWGKKAGRLGFSSTLAPTLASTLVGVILTGALGTLMVREWQAFAVMKAPAPPAAVVPTGAEALGIARDIQKRTGTNYAFAWEPEGWLRITGFDGDPAASRAMREGLAQRQIPYRARTRKLSVYLQATRTSLRHLLGSEALTVAADSTAPGTLLLSGTLPAGHDWPAALVALKREIPGDVQFVDRVQAGATAARPRVSVARRKQVAHPVVRAVSLGPEPFVQLANGARYRVGMSVPGGEVVAAIESNRVILRKGDRTRKIHLGGKPHD